MKMISDSLETPNSSRKDFFIREYRDSFLKKKVNIYELIIQQICYIRIPVWIASLIVLFIAIWGILGNREILFSVSALMPFVSGVAVLESFRSRMYGMTEMEGVTLVSMRGILFSRIICVGSVHILLLLMLSVILSSNSGYGFVLTGSILTIPYLISSVGSMMLERTELGRKNNYGCLIISAIVSALIIIIQNEIVLFSEQFEWMFVMTLVVLIIMEFVEIRKCFMWEDYSWN